MSLTEEVGRPCHSTYRQRRNADFDPSICTIRYHLCFKVWYEMFTYNLWNISTNFHDKSSYHEWPCFLSCPSQLIINGRTIDGLMASALSMRNISAYNGPPCNVNPCMNGGVCIPKLNVVECRCPVDYMGDYCDKRELFLLLCWWVVVHF